MQCYDLRLRATISMLNASLWGGKNPEFIGNKLDGSFTALLQPCAESKRTDGETPGKRTSCLQSHRFLLLFLNVAAVKAGPGLEAEDTDARMEME